jgi:hypothetical protein
LWPAGGGLESARGRYEASAVKRLRQLLPGLGDEESFEAHFPGSIELAATEEQAELLKSGTGEFWDAGRVNTEYKSAPGCFHGGMFHSDGGMLHPAHATRALAKAAVDAGVNVQTNCKVIRIGGGAGEMGSGGSTGQGAGAGDGAAGVVEVVTERGVIEATMAVLVCERLVAHVAARAGGRRCTAHQPCARDETAAYGYTPPDTLTQAGARPSPLASRTSVIPIVQPSMSLGNKLRNPCWGLIRPVLARDFRQPVSKPPVDNPAIKLPKYTCK